MELHLPMLAFCLNGYGEYIKLSIDEVFGYPDETSYGGGYGARGNIQISIGGYQVNSQHYFTTGELFMFRQSLSQCYKTLSGIAKLNNTESELDLTVSFRKYGKVQITGCFQERPDLANRLEFEIESDQTCILQVIQQLGLVEKVFGGMKGMAFK